LPWLSCLPWLRRGAWLRRLRRLRRLLRTLGTVPLVLSSTTWRFRAERIPVRWFNPNR